MKNYPKNLLEFEKWFKTEADCLKYIFKLRWPDGFICPKCNHIKSWNRANGLFECSKCGYLCSLTAGTIFQDTKKPLSLWFRAAWHITNQKYGANALGLQKALGFGSYRTAWTWLHKFRRAMIRPARDLLSGTVQVDETYIGGKKSGKRGRGATGKALVLIMAEEKGKSIGRIRLQRINDASADSIEPAIKINVKPKSIIHTDGWLGYNSLNQIKYIHEKVRDSDNVGDDLLPSCHRVASLLKRWLLSTLQGAVSLKHLDYYLDEYTFRFNRRTSKFRGKLFYRLLQQAVAIEPVPLKFMVQKTIGIKT